MSQQQREAAFWDKRAGEHGLEQLETEHSVLAQEPFYRFLEGWVANPGGGSLLEVGSGWGVGTARLAAHAERVVGCDVAAESLRRGRTWLGHRNCDNAELVLAPVEALPFGDASFDTVVGYFVLHHLEDLDAGVAELKRVLRPGGRALFVETWGRNPALRAARHVIGLAGMRLGTEDEQPLMPHHLKRLVPPFASLRLHYPMLDLVKYLHLPLLALRKRGRESGLLTRGVDAVWPWPGAADRWLHRRLPALRSWGWHVAIELER